MGGVINGTYLDIASLPVAEVKARTERSPWPQRRPPAERVPQRQPPPESAPPPTLVLFAATTPGEADPLATGAVAALADATAPLCSGLATDSGVIC